MMAEVYAINQALQSEMRKRCINSLTAVDAAALLDETGVLADSPVRRGLPLRNLLREGKIIGAQQVPNQLNGRWYIDRIESDTM